MTKNLCLFAGIFIFSVVSSFAQTLKLPFNDVGACPFECCTYQQWTANKQTVLLKSMTRSSPAVFKVRKGETVRGLTGVAITTKAGIGRATQNANLEYYNEKKNTVRNVPVKKGERFLILTYLGEGVYKVWYKGQLLQTSLDTQVYKVESEPKSVWWVKIKNRKGQIGWTKLTDHFDNMDSCG